jgi:hypothetical protein
VISLSELREKWWLVSGSENRWYVGRLVQRDEDSIALHPAYSFSVDIAAQEGGKFQRSVRVMPILFLAGNICLRLHGTFTRISCEDLTDAELEQLAQCLEQAHDQRTLLLRSQSRVVLAAALPRACEDRP